MSSCIPVTDYPLHADFVRVSAGGRVTVEVPVVFRNEDISPGLKRGGVLNIVRRDLELSCPADAIPAEIAIDLAPFDLGDSRAHLPRHPARGGAPDHHRSRLHGRDHRGADRGPRRRGREAAAAAATEAEAQPEAPSTQAPTRP